MNIEQYIDTTNGQDRIKSTRELHKEFIHTYPGKSGLNRHECPGLDSIILSTCYGAERDKADLIISELGTIAMQRPVITYAKKSVSNFKLREGMKLGAFVTLRGEKMFDWLDHFIMVAAPRIRNFQGFSVKAFDRHNNLNFGVKRQQDFIVPVSNLVFGFNVCMKVNYTAKNDKIHSVRKPHVIALFRYLGFPFWNLGDVK